MVARLKHGQVIELSRLIEAQFTKGDNGNWMWADGWDDARIASECAIKGVTTEHVARLRKVAYGDPPKVRKGAAALLHLASKIGDLEKRVTALEHRAAPPETHVNGRQPGRIARS